MDFVPERPLSDYPCGVPVLVRALGTLVNRLQATPAFPPVFDYPSRLEPAGRCHSGLFAPGLLDRHCEGFERIREVYPGTAAHWSPATMTSIPGTFFSMASGCGWSTGDCLSQRSPLDVATRPFSSPARRSWSRSAAVLAAGAGSRRRASPDAAACALFYGCAASLNVANTPAAAVPATDLEAPTLEQVRNALAEGQLIAGAPETQRIFGKIALVGFWPVWQRRSSRGSSWSGRAKASAVAVATAWRVRRQHRRRRRWLRRTARPASWKASGKPSLPKPQHTVIAGWPVTLNGMLSEGLPRKWKIACGSSKISGASPLVGRHHQVVAAHGRARVELQLAAEAQRREVLLGGEEGAELEAPARRVAELLRRLDHLLAMDGVRLGGDDDAAADVIVPDVGEDDFLDDGAQVAQHAHRLVHALGHVGRDGPALVPGAGERDAHALDRALRRPRRSRPWAPWPTPGRWDRSPPARRASARCPRPSRRAGPPCRS